MNAPGSPDPLARTAPEEWAGWTALDQRAVDLARVLAMDAVERADSGHPGTAMSLAPAAYLLFQRLLRHDPADPHWLGRDRFVLSAGHTSLTLYTQLYLAGYGITLDDLRQYRSWGSITPGHPEHGLTPGVETTTGPLGQGFANAVGMAMAARRTRGLLDPDAAPGTSPFDHHVYALASDGDIQEGINHEAAALAGHHRLGNLTVLFDDNAVSIDDDTAIATSEDVCARYRAYGWHVQQVDWRAPDGSYHEDTAALWRALRAARETTGQPSFIALRTVIAWPAPNARSTSGAHGSPLGADEVAATKQLLGFDPAVDFPADDEAVAHARQAADRGKRLHAEWDEALAGWERAHPDRAALLARLTARELPEGWEDSLPHIAPSPGGMATRKASGAVLNALAGLLPELWGGSADLATSNSTVMTGEPSFLPTERQTRLYPGNPYGRMLHFGIREHAMGAICNGIALHGLTRPYCGTFLIFSDYMRPAVRLAALMKLGVTYIWTHDSIGVGGDGPTHQPVEHLWSLRAIPGLDVVRPADANEAIAAWRTILTRPSTPAALCLSRQNVPVLDRSCSDEAFARGDGLASASGTARGGYILAEAPGGSPDVILIATGSEVHIALAARDQLAAGGVAARVVSMPCVEWFTGQDLAYRETVLPPGVRARVCVEAGIALGWREFAGDAGECISLEHFGASANGPVLYGKFGLTAERVAEAARTSLAKAGQDGTGRDTTEGQRL